MCIEMKQKIQDNFSLALVILIGLATGAGMVYLGLVVRSIRAVPDTDLASWFGVQSLAGAVGATPSQAGWALVLMGVFWFAAVAVLGARHFWGWWAALLASIVSVIFFPGGAIAALLVVSFLLFTSVRILSGGEQSDQLLPMMPAAAPVSAIKPVRAGKPPAAKRKTAAPARKRPATRRP
jgi:hypothetical protein